MRCEFSDQEWSIIRAMLPTKPRGIPRVDDRRVLNGIFWVLRSGAPWRDLPPIYGPRTTCYNRFVRWRRAAAMLDLVEEPLDAIARTIEVGTEADGLSAIALRRDVGPRSLLVDK